MKSVVFGPQNYSEKIFSIEMSFFFAKKKGFIWLLYLCGSRKKTCENLKAAYPDVSRKAGKLLNRAKKDLEDWVKK